MVMAMGLTLIIQTNCGPRIPTSPSLPSLVFYVLSSDLPLGTLRCCLNTLLIISFVSYYVAKSRCLEALSPTTGPPTALLKSLSKKLYLQLDNCAGTNKNQFVMAYLSLLTARKVFKEIQVGSSWLVTLTKISMPTSATSPRNSKTPTPLSSPTFMKEFMTFQHLPFVPQLIQEVADFQGLHKRLSSGWS